MDISKLYILWDRIFGGGKFYVPSSFFGGLYNKYGHKYLVPRNVLNFRPHRHSNLSLFDQSYFCLEFGSSAIFISLISWVFWFCCCSYCEYSLAYVCSRICALKKCCHLAANVPCHFISFFIHRHHKFPFKLNYWDIQNWCFARLWLVGWLAAAACFRSVVFHSVMPTWKFINISILNSAIFPQCLFSCSSIAVRKWTFEFLISSIRIHNLVPLLGILIDIQVLLQINWLSRLIRF